MTSNVAVLGLGAMGAPIAISLKEAGFQLVAWNRTRRSIPELESSLASGTPAEAVRNAEFVVTMLADDRAVESVTLGEHGLLSGLEPGATHIGMSTVSVGLTRRLAQEHAARDSHYVAAPVFGRPEAAKARALWVVPGGDPEAVRRCTPLFQAIGQGIFAMGTAEQAALSKLAGNFLIAATIESLGEALTMGERGGIDPERLLAMLTGTLFGSPIARNYGARIASTAWEPAGFALPLGLKDVRLALDAAHTVGSTLPIAELVRQRMEAALHRGRERYDWVGFASVIREDAGLGPTR